MRFHRQSIIIVAVAAGLVVLLDQLSKLWVVENISQIPSQVLLEDFLRLRFTRNTGAAFGIFQGGAGVLSVAAIAIVGAIIFSATRMGSNNRLTVLSMGLIVGGALGNLIDRLRLGYVVDFIEVYGPRVQIGDSVYTWPVFNAADSAISVGVVLLVTTMLFGNSDRPIEPVTTDQPESTPTPHPDEKYIPTADDRQPTSIR
ncbi:MAG TPA: signal peptidase II [Chloroflexia bacterium]